MKAISKIVAICAASALALCMFGCGGGGGSASTNPDEAKQYTGEEVKAKDVTITKSGYSIVDVQTVAGSDEGGTIEPATTTTQEVNFAFLATNPNDGYVAQNVPFTINGYNEAGDTVFSAGAAVMYMYPGIDTAVSGTASIMPTEGMDTKIAKFEVLPMMSTVEYYKTGLSTGDLQKMFTIKNVDVVDEDGNITVNAAVDGNIADGDKIFKVADIENTLEGHAVCLFFNDNGDIIFGSSSTNILIDQTTADLMKNSDTAIDNVSLSISNAPSFANYQLYVMPGL